MEAAYSEALRGLSGRRCPRRTIFPPNRLETRNWDLLSGLPKLFDGDPLSDLADFLRRLTGRRHILFAPSCRAAIAQILSLLPHQEVVMPAFTCPDVKTAVQIAGKRIIYVDTARNQVNSTSVQFERHARSGRVLMPTHLLGIPTDVQAICKLAKERGCVTIEDAAAALGARYQGRQLGTFADFGIFSFERSKRFPAFRGGAIVVNNEQIIDPEKLADARLTETRQTWPGRELVFALAYNFATVPWLYGRVVLPRQLRKYACWESAMGISSVNDALRSSFYTQRFHRFQAALVLGMLSRLDRIREQIRQLVLTYLDALKGTPVVALLPEYCDEAALLRFPVVLPKLDRSQVLRLALQRGVFLETNYERILADQGAEVSFPNAQWASRNLVLLPLYTALSLADAKQLAQQIAAIGSG